MTSQRGFTLLEMAFVMLVVGLLASTLVPLASAVHHKQMADTDRKRILDLRDEIMGRFLATGQLPSSLTGIALPITDSRGVSIGYVANSDLKSTTLNSGPTSACTVLDGLIISSSSGPQICAGAPTETSYCQSKNSVAFVLLGTGAVRNENTPDPLNRNLTALSGTNPTYVFESPQRPLNESTGYDDVVEVVTFAQLRKAVSDFCK